MLSVVGRNFSSFSSHRLLLTGNVAIHSSSRVISSRQGQIPHYHRFQQQQGHYNNNRKTHVVTSSNFQQQQQSKLRSYLWLTHNHHPRPSLSSSGLTRSSSSLPSSSSSLLTKLRGLIPTFIWALSGVGIVGSFLSGTELCHSFVISFFPYELALHYETMWYRDDLKHHLYPLEREVKEPAILFYYALNAAVLFKLESFVSKSRNSSGLLATAICQLKSLYKSNSRRILPLYGSRTAALWITGINVAVGLALNNIFYFPNNETYFKRSFGFVPHLRTYPRNNPELWFKFVASQKEEMTPYQRRLFLREQWYHFGKTVVVMPFIYTVLYHRLILQNALPLTKNPITGVAFIGLFFSGFCESASRIEKHVVVYAPIADFLWNMTISISYVATGRLLVPFVAIGLNNLMDLIQHQPSTLPFQLSVGVSKHKAYNKSNKKGDN